MDLEENRFRYKVESLAAIQMENQLNFLGSQGWELVSVIFHPEEEYPYRCFFKQRASG